jgi:tRNA(adenine34) deaminase
MDQHTFSEQDERFMGLAIEQAQLALDRGEIPVGAVAVRHDQVIARGHNSKEQDKDPTKHAEVTAIRRAARFLGGWRLLDVTLYCTMEPCPMCAGAMVQARLPRLVYAVDDPKAGAAGSILDLLDNPKLNHRVHVTRGVLAHEAEALLDSFFRGLRQGTIPRYSQAWRSRQLAEKHRP